MINTGYKTRYEEFLKEIKKKYAKKYLSEWVYKDKPVALWKKEIPQPDEIWDFFEEEVLSAIEKIDRDLEFYPSRDPLRMRL